MIVRDENLFYPSLSKQTLVPQLRSNEVLEGGLGRSRVELQSLSKTKSPPLQ